MRATPALFLRILALILALHAPAWSQPLPMPAVLGQPSAQPAASSLARPPTTVGQPSAAAPAPSPASTVTPAAIAPRLAASPGAVNEVFGAHLFTGGFAREGASFFNPEYVIATGDTIQVRLWGAFELDSALTVDPQGNIFLPYVGPVPLRGLRNLDLQSAVESAVGRVFRADVRSYASLAAAQPVRVFVTGFVQRPGLYSGTSMDSLLHYLDQAGGIDPDRGTFLEVQVQRQSRIRATVNLYDFLLRGGMPSVQLGAGDVIFIPARKGTVRASGLAASPNRFEFTGDHLPLPELQAMARPRAEATHLRVTRNTGTVRNVESYPLEAAAHVKLFNGDEVEFTADKKPGTITVRVQGEHSGAQEYVMPYGSRLGELMAKIRPGPDAELASIQLFRQSVKERQKELLATSLRSLETALLTARSGSADEARLRKEEAELTLQWIERARQVEPLGQVQIAQNANRGDMLLENGDIVVIPRNDALVLVSGEVLFPNAVAHQPELRVAEYINRSGGYTQSADDTRVVIARRDGRFEQIDTTRWRLGGRNEVKVMPGDQVLVLPRVDEKNRQFWKDMTQIIYQIAVSAKVVFGL